jgi:hypothetical protein
MCGGLVGIGPPFGIFGVHACVLSLHQWSEVQSASTAQPPAGSQVPFVLHMPERHTALPFVIVHGPSPFA